MVSLENKIRISRFIEEIKFRLISDERHAKKVYFKRKGKKMDLSNPQTFTDKLQYLKLFYRNPLMKICADKYYAREYVKLCGYEAILKKIYAVYNEVDEINLEKLPKEFFIHWNHMSGGNFAIKDGKIGEKTKELLVEYKKTNWYHHGREWQYGEIIPKLLCEELLKNSDGTSLVDYKFYCFNGKVKYYMISFGELEHEHRNHKFDVDGESIDHLFKSKPTIAECDVKKPHNITEMIRIAEGLATPFPHVRVDLYNIDGRIVFGELTFYSDSGFVNVYSEEMDKRIGSWIDLEKYKDDFVGK